MHIYFIIQDVVSKCHPCVCLISPFQTLHEKVAIGCSKLENATNRK